VGLARRAAAMAESAAARVARAERRAEEAVRLAAMAATVEERAESVQSEAVAAGGREEEVWVVVAMGQEGRVKAGLVLEGAGVADRPVVAAADPKSR